MKLLKITFLLLFLIISMGFASAQDMDSTSLTDCDTHDGLETMQIDDDGVVEEYSFFDLNNIINNSGDVLKIEHDYKFNNKTDDSKGITISRNNFVIEGNGHKIDASNRSAIFTINGSNITINNLTFINANSNRGSVFNIPINSSLTTNNVTFKDSLATDMGVIYVRGSYISNDDSFIDLESANYGVVMVNSANASFTNAFMMSSKQLAWGLIFAFKDSRVYVFNSTFANTTSKYSTAVHGAKTTIIRDSKFINLHANITAGAIGIKEIEGCVIDNCTFINVSSKRNGGAIFADAYSSNDFKQVLINKSNFIDCYCEYGGAIMQLGGNLTVDNSSFTNNSASFDGGAIYTSYVIVYISNSSFNGNYALYDDGNWSGCGGAIFCDACGLNLIDCELDYNRADSGGAIYLYDSNYYIVNNSFNSNFKPNDDFVNKSFNSNFKPNDGDYDDVYSVFDAAFAVLENNTYGGNDTLNLNNKNYESIVNASGMKLTPINNTFDVVTIPSRFDLREWGGVTPLEDQGFMGACWAFGTSGAIESSILWNLGIEMNISENNMQDVSLQYYKYGTKGFFEGGSIEAGCAYALSWFGVFPSEYDEYDELGKISSIIAADESIHFQDVIMFYPRQNLTDNDFLKRALLKYGALAVSIAIVQTVPYYNDSNGAVYCNVSSPDKHAVTLVGWDDNYSASNFLLTPPGDGAWLIKNSWGANHGDNGYCHVSYYDPSFVMDTPAFAFLLDNTVDYNKNYQYDIGGILSYNSLSNEYFNVFRAVEDDLIAGVGTYFNESGVDYSVEIYVNNVLMLNQSGISPFCGFHTIQLDSFIPIKRGDVFYVKVTSNAVPILSNSRQHYMEGSSYILVNDTWVKTTDYDQVCSIKAYTVCDDTKVINNRNIAVDYGGGSYFNVKVVTADGHAVGAGEKVTFTINGHKTTVITDAKGIAKVKITDVPKKYTVTTTYNGKTYKNTVTVKQVLTAGKVTVKKIAKKFTLKAKLKINGKLIKGKWITFKFNGKTYKAKTNSKGIAQKTLNKNVIKKLKKGKTYTVKVSYLKDTIKTTLKVR